MPGALRGWTKSGKAPKMASPEDADGSGEDGIRRALSALPYTCLPLRQPLNVDVSACPQRFPWLLW